jgi:hypothetical protein
MTDLIKSGCNDADRVYLVYHREHSNEPSSSVKGDLRISLLSTTLLTSQLGLCSTDQASCRIT